MDKLLRFFEIIIVGVVFYYRAFIRLKGKDEATDRERSVLLRESIERLGSVFVKFGQFVAVHPLYLPEIYTRELFLLLEDVPAFPYSEVKRIFNEDFGKRPAEVFKHFEDVPFAAASFGQVYIAVLKTGEKVAVKVQRPHIYSLVQKDLSLLKFLGSVIDLFPLGPNKIVPLITEFERLTYNELDYQIEAKANQAYFAFTKDKRDKISAPKVYMQYCGSRVLTTEYIAGITLSKIILAIKKKDEVVVSKIKKWGFEAETVALFIFKDFMRQMYLEGFFHADPHPANIIFTTQGKLVFIDFGIFGQFDKRQTMIFMRYARSFWWNDTESAFESLGEMCDFSRVKDRVSFKKDFVALMEQVRARVLSRKATGLYQAGVSVQETLTLLQKHKAVMPAQTMLYFRTILMLRNYTSSLYPLVDSNEFVKWMKVITIENFVMELPKILSKEKAGSLFKKLITVYEKEFYL